jgi:glycosyltransferase involved in cell wall biosynthesis
MKITFLSEDFPPLAFGGAGISTYELALAMSNDGHEVSIITTCRNQSEAGKFNYDNLTIYRFVTNYNARFRAYISLYNRSVIKEVEKVLKELRPDVVHANNIHYYLSYHSLKIAKKYAKTVILTARDTMLFSYGKLETSVYLKSMDPRLSWLDNIKQSHKRWNPLRNIIIRMYLKYVDKVIAISEALQIALEKNGINNVSVIYNGINIDEWKERGVKERESFRKKYNLEGKKIILFSGRLSYGKGGEKAIQALAIISKDIPNVVLLVAGSKDWYAEEMMRLAKKLNVGKQVIFTGWLDREKIKDAYGVCDVVLFPSIYLEAFGRVNIESMASKKPVVGTCFGGTPEIIADGVTGYVVNPLHPEKLAEKLLDLLKNEDKARSMGMAGYERVSSKFNLDDKVREYITLYESLV